MFCVCVPRTALKSTVILLPLLGLTWIIGPFSLLMNTDVLSWIFAILNSLQVRNSNCCCQIFAYSCMFFHMRLQSVPKNQTLQYNYREKLPLLHTEHYILWLTVCGVFSFCRDYFSSCYMFSEMIRLRYYQQSLGLFKT